MNRFVAIGACVFGLVSAAFAAEPVYWNGSGWTNGTGTVISPTSAHTLVMRDGDAIVFSSVTKPGGVQLPAGGYVTISGQDKLQNVTLDIPSGCTLEVTSNADLGANGVTGNGTLAYNPGGVAATVISTGKFSNFKGTFWMKSGRHNYGSAIASSVTLKVTHGSQLWLTGGTWNNVFRLSGQGWVNPEQEYQNDIEHAAMRLEAEATLSANAWLVFVKGADGLTPTIGTIVENGVSIASNLMGTDGFEKRGSGPITLIAPKTQAENLSGECVVATGVLQIGNNAGFGVGDTVKIGSGITINDGATLNVWCWTTGTVSANTNDMVHITNDITIRNGGTLQTVDGAYDFRGRVTAHDGARGRFVYRKSWVFMDLVIPADATFDAVVAGDERRDIYLSILGGDVKGTLQVTNEGTGRVLYKDPELRVALSGTALADGTIDFVSPNQKSWIVLVGDATLGNVTGDTDAAFGDGVATRNLTLTGGTYDITFKGVDKGTEQFDKLNLVIASDVTLVRKGTYNTCSGTLTVKEGATLKFVDVTALPSGGIGGSGRVECPNATGVASLPAGFWAEDWTGTFAYGGFGNVTVQNLDVASFFNGTNSACEFGTSTADKVTATSFGAADFEVGALTLKAKVTLTDIDGSRSYRFAKVTGNRTLNLTGGKGSTLQIDDVSEYTGTLNNNVGGNAADGLTVIFGSGHAGRVTLPSAICLTGDVTLNTITLAAANGVTILGDACVTLAPGSTSFTRISQVTAGTVSFEEGAKLVFGNRYSQFAAGHSAVKVSDGATIPVEIADPQNLAAGICTLMTWAERPLGSFELLTDVPVEPGKKVYAAQKEPNGLVIVESVYFTFGGKVMPFEEQWLKDAGVWSEESVEETEKNLAIPNENGISPGLAYMLGFAAEDAAGAQYALEITLQPSPSPSSSPSPLISLTIPGADARRNGARVLSTLEATPDVRDWTNPRVIELKTATTFLDDRTVTGAPQQFYRASMTLVP